MTPAKHPEKEAFWKHVYQDVTQEAEHWDDLKALETLLLFAVTPEKAREFSSLLLNRFGSLSGVLDANAGALESRFGLPLSAVTLLKLIVPLSRKSMLETRCPMAPKKPSALIRTPEDAKACFAPYFYGYTTEAVFALYLDSGCKVTDCRKVSVGSETLVNIDARRLAESALNTAAVSLYLAHNHPRGRARPSQKDRDITRRLTAELACVDLCLLDHFIFADDQAVSLKEYQERNIAEAIQKRE